MSLLRPQCSGHTVLHKAAERGLGGGGMMLEAAQALAGPPTWRKGDKEHSWCAWMSLVYIYIYIYLIVTGPKNPWTSLDPL